MAVAARVNPKDYFSVGRVGAVRGALAAGAGSPWWRIAGRSSRSATAAAIVWPMTAAVGGDGDRRAPAGAGHPDARRRAWRAAPRPEDQRLAGRVAVRRRPPELPPLSPPAPQVRPAGRGPRPRPLRARSRSPAPRCGARSSATSPARPGSSRSSAGSAANLNASAAAARRSGRSSPRRSCASAAG